MEKGLRDSSIRVKQKFCSHIKQLSSIDNLLSTVKLYQIEDAPLEEEAYVHFRIIPIERMPPPSINELQVISLFLCIILGTKVHQLFLKHL